MKVAVFRDPLQQTLSLKLSELYGEGAIAENTEFTLLRLFAPKVQDYIASRGRAEPDSIWARWSKEGIRQDECPTCEGAKEVDGAKCAFCSGSGKVTELVNSVPQSVLAELMAALTVRANPLRMDVSENGGEPEIELWDTASHPKDEAHEILTDFYREMPELTVMLLVRSFEAQAAYAKAYEATRKNLPTSSPRKRAGGAKRRKKPSA